MVGNNLLGENLIVRKVLKRGAFVFLPPNLPLFTLALASDHVRWVQELRAAMVAFDGLVFGH
jgi:hypothetical protein